MFKSARQRRLELEKRLSAAVTKELTSEEITKLVGAYKKKAVRRLKVFYEESQRMDKKLPQLFETLDQLGYKLDKVTLNSVQAEDILNFRKKSTAITFAVAGKKDTYDLHGLLTISPASIKIELNSQDIDNIRTKSGWALPLLKITYYRTLNIRDNYLAALVKNGTNKAKRYNWTESLV